MWALSIDGYNCKIEYIAGTENVCADLLSRSPPSDKDTNENLKLKLYKTFEMDTLNTNKFSSKHFTSYKLPADTVEKLDKVKYKTKQKLNRKSNKTFNNNKQSSDLNSEI